MTWPIAPMKAANGPLPRGAAWMYEPKWDGHRALVRISGGVVDAVSSTGKARMQSWPWLAAVMDAVHGEDTIVDGEVIAQGDDGKHSFQAVGRTDREHVFVAFDLLSIGDTDLMSRPWAERRALLEATIQPSGRVIVTPSTDDGEALMIATRANGFEGVIAKRIDSTYFPGRRSPSWVKVKHRLEQEFVVGGYLLGEGNRTSTFGSLLLGVYEGSVLHFAGAVGTGFNDLTLHSIRKGLNALATDTCPFDEVPAVVRRRVKWVRPEMVAQVTFAEWTEDQHLRHPVFVGLRDDKRPLDVVRE